MLRCKWATLSFDRVRLEPTERVAMSNNVFATKCGTVDYNIALRKMWEGVAPVISRAVCIKGKLRGEVRSDVILVGIVQAYTRTETVMFPKGFSYESIPDATVLYIKMVDGDTYMIVKDD